MTDTQIDDEYLLKLLADLVAVPSVFPHEEEIMLFLERELHRIGLPPRRIPISETRFNLLSRIGTAGPVLCLNAHTDTVPASGNSVPQARISGGALCGLGSADDKSSVAAMVAAAKGVAESGVPLAGTLDLLISVDEEGEGAGVRTAIESGYRCDMAITGEPTSLEIVRAHCGIVFLDMVARGESTHGSIPMKGVNAIDRMYQLVLGLREAVTGYAAHHLVGPPTLNLGIMHGGDRPNRVPDRCEASVDVRMVSPMTVEQILARVDARFAQWDGKAEYKVTKRGNPLDTSPDSPLVKGLVLASERVSGTASPVVGWRGWTEAESFQTGLGIEAVVFGPGALKQAHSGDEWVDLEEVRKAAGVYSQTVLAILCPEAKR